MKKRDKTPTGNQNINPQSQTQRHKAGISFNPETWKQLKTYAWAEFKGVLFFLCSMLHLHSFASGGVEGPVL